jgi:phage gpG-like protein
MLTRLGATGRIEFQQLLDGLSRQGMTQTRRRIEVEKTSPEGKAWPKTRDGRGALFVTGTHLARSIDHAVVGDAAVWGSGWIGARVHQFGAVIKPVNGKALKFSIGGKTVFAKKATIPARPYLGVSEANARALEQTAARFIGSLLQ